MEQSASPPLSFSRSSSIYASHSKHLPCRNQLDHNQLLIARVTSSCVLTHTKSVGALRVHQWAAAHTWPAVLRLPLQ
jgi:hypothetical protein